MVEVVYSEVVDVEVRKFVVFIVVFRLDACRRGMITDPHLSLWANYPGDQTRYTKPIGNAKNYELLIRVSYGIQVSCA